MNGSNHSGRSRNRSSALLLCSIFYFVLRFLGICSPSRFPEAVTSRCYSDRSVEDCLNGDVDGRTASGISGQSWNYKGYVVVGLAKKCLPYWSIVAFVRWTTRRNILGLRRAFRAIEAAGVSSSNFTVTYEPRSWTPLFCASSNVCTSPLAVINHCWVSGPFKSVHFNRCSNFSCSACALALLNQPRILAPLVIVKWAPPLPWLRKESKT